MAMKASTTSDGRVVFLVEADDSKLDSQLKGTTQKIKDESKNWGSAAKENMGKEMDSLLGKVARLGEAFGRFAVQFISESIDLAETVKELEGPLESVFGAEGSAKIDKWSKNVVKQFGLSELAAKKYASKAGLLAKRTGMDEASAYLVSTGVAGMAADLAAAVPGTSSDAAFEAITNALQGKGTSLKTKFQIDLSDTELKKTYADFAKMDVMQQTAIRYAELEKRMKAMDYTGGFAQSKGSVQHSIQSMAANAENLKAKTGEALLPVKEAALGVAANAMDTLVNGIPEMAQTTDEAAQSIAYLTELLNKLDESLAKSVSNYANKYGFTQEAFAASGMEGKMTYGQWAYQQLGSGLMNGTIGDENDIEDMVDLYYSLESVDEAITKANGDIETMQLRFKSLENLENEKAKAAAEAEAQAIADGLAAKKENVASEVVAIISEINRLHTTGGLQFRGGTVIPPLASGLDYVPRDNYLASLHAGESVLTAEEAKVWRAMKYSSVQQSPDYSAWGATMRDNIHAGGNVYLDGQTVGRVISARQGDAYRAMERSGFQQ